MASPQRPIDMSPQTRSKQHKHDQFQPQNHNLVPQGSQQHTDHKQKKSSDDVDDGDVSSEDAAVPQSVPVAVYKKLRHTLIPPIQSTLSYGESVAPGPDDTKKASETKATETADESLPEEEDVDVATVVPADKKNIFGLIATSSLYNEVRNYVKTQTTRYRSNTRDSGESRIPSLAYGIDSSDEEDEDDDEEDEDEEDEDEEDEDEEDEDEEDEDEEDEEQALFDGSESEESSLDAFEDAQEHDTRSEQTLRPTPLLASHPRSDAPDIASLMSSFALKDEPVDLSKLTTFQRSIIDNFHIQYADGVLMRYTDSETSKSSQTAAQLSHKMKLSIADRLQKVFNLDDGDYFYTNYNAWLVRDVFLQGHVYLTRNCVLFFAFLPQSLSSQSAKPSSSASTSEFKKQDDSNVYIQTGSLTMKTKKYGEILGTVLTNRFWAILRPETLSIYSSPTDLYFPTLVIDLRTCSKVEILDKYQPKTENASKYSGTYGQGSSALSDPSPMMSPKDTESRNPFQEEFNDEGELSKMLAIEAEDNKENISGGVWFKITTNKKSYKFHTDNLYSARQWVNNITKIIFQLHNTNSKNEVLIKVPFDRISQFYRKNLFNVTSQADSGMDENYKHIKDTLPSVFSVNYSSGVVDSASTAVKMSKKISEKTKQKINPLDDVEWLHFALFSKGTEFEDSVAKIIQERDAQQDQDVDDQASTADTESAETLMTKLKKKRFGSTSSKSTDLPMSTLSRAGNYSAILDQVLPVNQNLFNNNPLLSTSLSRDLKTGSSDSKLKKISKTLSTKVFTPSRTRSDTQVSNASFSTPSLPIVSPGNGTMSPLDRAYGSSNSNLVSPQPSMAISPSETSIRSSESASPSNLNLPRQMSLTGLKNLNMTFEASKRDIEVAADRYGDTNDEAGGTFAVREILPGPLTLADPSEYTTDDPQHKDTKLKTLGKSIKALSQVTTRWSAHPYHYVKLEDEDSYYVDGSANDLGNRRYRSHFSLGESHKLAATYFCHVQRALPVYGKLYVGHEMICFRSLLPGVSTRMILPLRDVENCYKQRGTKITYHGLTIVIKGHEKLYVEFSSQRARDDCLEMTLEMLHQLHGTEAWKPKAHEWGHNYDIELGRERLENDTDDASSSLASPYSDETLKQASARIESARIKLFEDRFTLAAGLQLPIVLEDSPFVKTEIRPNTSYHFVLLTIGSRGDVQPYIALGKGLIAEGHRVTIATHSEFKDWIVKHGIGFKEVAGDPTELMSLMVTHGSMSVAFIKEASAKFKGWISDLLSTAWLACQGADILIESPSAMAGVHIAEALGIPYMRAFTMPWTRTRAYSHAFILPDQKKGGSYNYLTHIMFETVFWKGISSQVNKWRVEHLNLPRTSLYKLQQHKIPFLYNVSKSVLAPAVDFPDWVKVTGYWFLDEGAAKDYEPPADLLEFMAQASMDNKKIVYIGFGSIVVNDARSLTEAVIEAVLDADVRCILNKGWSDRGEKSAKEPVQFPPEIFNVESIPHDWLFARIDAAVHHGGSGTTGASLRSGLPTIIKPFFGDQFFYAARVEEVGAGIGLKKLNAKTLSKALQVATTDIKIIERAKLISEEIRNEHGVLSAIETIYSELEYARSLIVNKQIANEQSRLHAGSRSATGTYALNTPQNEQDTDSELDDDEEDNFYDHYDNKSDLGIQIDYAYKS